MRFFGPVQYQPEWIQKLAEHHVENSKVISIYPTRENVDARFPGRDREGEDRSSLAGLYLHVTRHLPKHACSVSQWTGKELKDQFGAEPVGVQYMTDYTVIVL